MNVNVVGSILGIIAIPISIVSLITSINTNKSTSKLSEIVARQHDINPKKIKSNAERLPLVRRTINIVDVKFDSTGKARVFFTDNAIERTKFSQMGCPAFAAKIGKSYNVDYNTVKNYYAISCEHTLKALSK